MKYYEEHWNSKKIDNLGRIVIPKEYRNSLKIEDSEQLEILLINGGILIRKARKTCAI